MKQITRKPAGRALLISLLSVLLCVLLCGTAVAANPFTDVSRDKPYYTAVMWALDSGVTKGTTATTFSPGSVCNRGQVVTFLWRAAGQPEPSSQRNPFSDVAAASYCYKAVLWAVQQGITNGTTASTFSPTNPCTYGHVLTFLWRSLGSPASSGYSSLAQEYPGIFCTSAMAWAETTGILSDTDLTPGSPCPRSEIVSYLYRWAAPGSVLSLFPELAADREEIPLEDMQGIYQDGNIEFILELQSDGESEPEVLFIVQNASGNAIAGFTRICPNIYQSRYDNGDNFTLGFSRVDGTVYLDYYRNGVHKNKITRVSWEDDNPSLAQYPELSPDGTEIPLSEIGGQYQDGNLEFIVEFQSDGESEPEMLFIAQDRDTYETVAGFHRVGVNLSTCAVNLAV